MLPVLAFDSIFRHGRRVWRKRLTQFPSKLKNLPVRLHYWRIHRRNLLFGYPLLHQQNKYKCVYITPISQNVPHKLKLISFMQNFIV